MTEYDKIYALCSEIGMSVEYLNFVQGEWVLEATMLDYATKTFKGCYKGLIRELKTYLPRERK